MFTLYFFHDETTQDSLSYEFEDRNDALEVAMAAVRTEEIFPIAEIRDEDGVLVNRITPVNSL
jgi:hypothetical protein